MSGASSGTRAAAPLILLVDDEFAILEALSDLLRLEGFRVSTAADGREALQALAVEVPAVALLDVMMPGMNGLALIEAIRADPRWRDIPVVVMTAAFGAIPRAVATTVRMVAKPFHIDVLLAALREVIAGGRDSAR